MLNSRTIDTDLGGVRDHGVHLSWNTNMNSVHMMSRKTDELNFDKMMNLK